jgi:hypothetical protein
MTLQVWKWPKSVYDTETDRWFRHLDDNDKVDKAYDASKWLAVIIAHPQPPSRKYPARRGAE